MIIFVIVSKVSFPYKNYIITSDKISPLKINNKYNIEIYNNKIMFYKNNKIIIIDTNDVIFISNDSIKNIRIEKNIKEPIKFKDWLINDNREFNIIYCPKNKIFND